MPIDIPIPISPITKTDFDAVDRVVMKCAYAAQNHFGNLCDEKVYENDVAARLRAEGFEDVHTQLPVTVSYNAFSKPYFLDLVVRKMVYELKAEKAISPAHQAQALNYTALLELNRIKLVNFGADSVQGKLLGAPFAEVDRYRVTFDFSQLWSLSSHCELLSNHVKGLVEEIGGYLSAALYREALIEAFGGEEACVRRLPVSRDGIEMGTHRTSLHDADVAFAVTALGKGLAQYVQQLQTLSAALPIKGMQLINIHHCDVQIITISNHS